jgi:hypothetical protein
MSKGEKVKKVKAEKKYTRAQALRAMSGGADPTTFEKHANYHVKKKAWQLLGSVLPEDAGERAKLLASLHIKEKVEAPVEAPVEEMVATPASDTP